MLVKKRSIEVVDMHRLGKQSFTVSIAGLADSISS